MALPKKISPSPIIETVIEIIFASDMPSDAVFGLLYGKFKDKYPNYDKLPILQVPEAVRDLDSTLRNQAHYSLYNESFKLNIGPRVVTLIQNIKEGQAYVGWDTVNAEITNVVNTLKDLSIVKTIDRLGVRYINFFNDNILDNINITLNTHLTSTTTALIQEVPLGNFTVRLQIASNVDVIKAGQPKKGSVIDMDIYKTGGIPLEELISSIQSAHEEAKKLFFGILKQEFIDTLNPSYE